MNRNTEIECTSEFLSEKALSSLCQYQIDHLSREINDFIVQNTAAQSHIFKTCPKCGQPVSQFMKGGYTYIRKGDETVRGKVLLKCPICKKRFTVNHGQLPFYSHSDSDIWVKLIEDTISGVSIAKTAAEINRNPSTVFCMRHKFLAFITSLNDERKISKPCEADEKYIRECHKGLISAEIDEKSKTIRVKARNKKLVRGLSHEQVCVGTVIERNGKSYIQATNAGRPSAKDIHMVCTHICKDTYVWTDMNQDYKTVLEELHCPHKELKANHPYNQIDHLNTVNNLHSRMNEWIRQYRNVSSIYLNRYVALFAFRQAMTGCDLQEAVLRIIGWMKNRSQYFFVNDIHRKIFRDPAVMAARSGLMSWPVIRRLVIRSGYTVVNDNS
jgi:transposase-like protein